jgi:hypothetical protein
MSEELAQTPEISDETRDRFLGFVKERVGQSGEATSSGEKISTKLYRVEEAGELVPIDSIEFQFSDRETPDELDKVMQGASITLRTKPPGAEALSDTDAGTMSYSVSDQKHTHLVEGDITRDASDVTLNEILDRIKAMEEQGRITPVEE